MEAASKKAAEKDRVRREFKDRVYDIPGMDPWVNIRDGAPGVTGGTLDFPRALTEEEYRAFCGLVQDFKAGL